MRPLDRLTAGPALCDNRCMSEVYFDGDPATDSARRHMERVLKGEPKRRWPWLAAALGGGAVWMLWRMGNSVAAARNQPGADEPGRMTSSEADATGGRGSKP